MGKIELFCVIVLILCSEVRSFIPTACKIAADQTGDSTMRCVSGVSCDLGDVDAGYPCRPGQLCCKRQATPLCGEERGVSRMKRALGYAPDDEYANPWIVNLIMLSATYCTGILIHEKYVLTDAICGHFVQDELDLGRDTTAVLGDFNTSSTDYFETSILVQQVFIHESSVPTSFNDLIGYIISGQWESLQENNIAVLELERPVEFLSQGVNVPCSPRGPSERACGEVCKVAAFGNIQPHYSYDGAFDGATRQLLYVKPVTDEVCKFHRNNLDMPAGTHCGFSITDDSALCFGDNGGALVCQDAVTGRWSLEGVLTWRPTLRNDGPGYPECSDQIFLYTDAKSHWTWVQSKLV